MQVRCQGCTFGQVGTWLSGQGDGDCDTCEIKEGSRAQQAPGHLVVSSRSKHSLIKQLQVEASWTTDKRAVALVEAQVLVGGPSDADPRAYAEESVCCARDGAITAGGRIKRPQP
jgi:hypothetical protein